MRHEPLGFRLCPYLGVVSKPMAAGHQLDSQNSWRGGVCWEPAPLYVSSEGDTLALGSRWRSRAFYAGYARSKER